MSGPPRCGRRGLAQSIENAGLVPLYLLHAYRDGFGLFGGNDQQAISISDNQVARPDNHAVDADRYV